MKSIHTPSEIIKPFLQVLTTAFVRLISLYGGVQRVHEELIRKNIHTVGIATLYRLYNSATSGDKMIPTGNIGDVLDIVLNLINKEDDQEHFQQRLANSIATAGKKT